MEWFSSLLFDTLDYIGYNPDMIRLRRNYWQQHDNIVNLKYKNVKIYSITAGSKGEGITSFYQSDIDFMYVVTEAICTDNVAQFSRIPDMTVIHADTSEAPPGYTRLKLVSINGDRSKQLLKDCAFESEFNEVSLSSTLFATAIKIGVKQTQLGGNFGDALSGPAVHGTEKDNPADFVYAFPCYYPQLLQSWRSRPRLHEWPPVHVRKEAASMLAQVVPVGSKGSCDQLREWRFCFIESELTLTYSLNGTQLKLYIVLKMVAKEILRPVSDEISSYIMKNVVYWLSELLPHTAFKKDNLFKLLILSLSFLKSAISQWNWFPYYMIPGRNLLAERLTPVSRRQLTGLIETLIQEGVHFLLRCVKLRTALSARINAPALLIRYRETRDRIELLSCCSRLLKKQNADRSYINATNQEVWDIVLPEWGMLLLSGIPKERISALIFEEVKAILS